MKLLDPQLANQIREVPESPEVIFREAKRRQRRRRLATGAAAVLVVGVVATIATALSSSTGTAPPPAARALGAHPAGTTGFRWERVATSAAPSVRIGAPTAYDPATRQLLLIGGVREITPTIGSAAQTTTVLGDTWVFAHGNWSQMTVGPRPPIGLSSDVLAYDPQRKTVICVTAPAGTTAAAHVAHPSTTWTWTGSHWSELLASGPGWGTTGAVMAYDLATHQVVFVPSSRPGTSVGSTYVLGASGWRREAKPPRLMWMAYDPVSRRLLGQNGSVGSMWWWTGKRWQLVTNRVLVHLKGGSYHGTLVEGANWVTDGSADEIVALGLFHASTPTELNPTESDLYTWLGNRWRPIDAPMHPKPVNQQFLSLAYDGSVGGVVAFGGGTGEQIGPRTSISGGNSTWALVRSR